MRTKILSVTMLLVLLLGLLGVAPVASQGPDQPFVVTPLSPSSNVTVGAEKDRAPNTIQPTFKADELRPVSIIVTYDESFDPSALETATGGTIVHRYNKIFKGVSLVLPGDKVEKAAALSGVTGIYLDRLQQPDTDVSPTFIGATTAWAQLGGQENAGEGIVVGVLDTGIWPEHPSFSDPDPSGKPYDPPGGSYDCDFGNTAWNPNDAPFTCNNKLIGAYTFLDTYRAVVGLVRYDPVTNLGEYDSARDDDGHGTHTSSTAAGNGGVAATMLGVDRGIVSGIAPRAHVVMYRVCALNGCYNSDSMAAVEQAIVDGVDVINFSISGGSAPYSDIVELAFLNAYENGVFVAASGGNDGPGADTVNHRGPWTMTVAASTHNRTYAANVTLNADNGDELVLDGVSITGGYTGDVVLAADYGDALCLNPFPAGTFDGQIVACERGIIARVTKSYNVAEGGAGGLILYNPVLQGLSSDPHYIPSIHIENDAGAALLSFMAAHTGVVGTLSGGITSPAQGDVMAAFSSRGGPGQTLGVSKPDITAPGVQILAGNTALGVAQGPGGMGPFGELFQAIGGTSMSSPHIAGSAALIKAMHPDWTPGQIKSALMTTAWIDGVVKEDGVTPVDPFDVGSGRVNLSKAGNPGLTISATGQDFRDHENDLWNANYPSLYVPVMPGRIVVERTVHSELPYFSWWIASVDSPSDVTVLVLPLIGVSAGGNKTFEIIVDARDVPLGEVRHATLYLKSMGKELRFPITIVRREPTVTLDKACDPATFVKNATTDCTITVENTSFDAATVSVIDILPKELQLVNGSVVGGDQHLLRWVTFDGTLYGAAAPEVTVVDGTGTTPGGYLPLSLFGIAPIAGVGDETIINFSVDPFVYAGDTYTAIGMVSNGYAVVGGGDAADVDYINQVLPDPERPNNVLASFWTDLNPAFGGELRAGYLSDGVSTWLVLDWENVVNYGDGEPNSFQIWVGTNGVEDISFTYGDVSDGDGGWLTVGAENAYGNSGQNWYADGAGTPVVAGDELRVVAVPGAPGETHTITYTAKGIRFGVWTNYVEMTGDTFFGTNIASFSGEVIH
jgi:uncharacterized repeat protein (TIGR01451 family)